MAYPTSLLRGVAFVLGVGACTSNARGGQDATVSRDSHRDSVTDPVVATLLADQPFRAAVELEGPTLVLFAARRSGADTALTPEGRRALLLADSVAVLARDLGVAVQIRTPANLRFQAPGRLIPGPSLNSTESGYVLAAPDTRLAVIHGLPSAGDLSAALRRWHDEWRAARPADQQSRAT